MEKWKNIFDYDNLYQVSNLGNVKSLKRKVKRKNNTPMVIKEKILKQQNVNGYKAVRLSKDGIVKQYFVHQLVARAFLSNENDYNEINHKDENKLNNNVNNLEWCSHLYNINYGTGNIRRSVAEIRTKRGGYCVC